jgi:hypothetical protein
MAGELEEPAFEVRVGPLNGEHRVYRVWANGKIEGFEDGDKPIMVCNRIPLISARARKDAMNGR